MGDARLPQPYNDSAHVQKMSAGGGERRGVHMRGEGMRGKAVRSTWLGQSSVCSCERGSVCLCVTNVCYMYIAHGCCGLCMLACQYQYHILRVHIFNTLPPYSHLHMGIPHHTLLLLVLCSSDVSYACVHVNTWCVHTYTNMYITHHMHIHMYITHHASHVYMHIPTCI